MSRHTAAVRMNLYRISAGFLGWCWVSAEYISLKPALALEVLEVLDFSLTLFCGENMNIQIEIEMIRAWLHKIGEPVNDPDNVILTIAIRDRYTFEMLIPKSKCDLFALLEAIEMAGTQ